MDAKTAAEVLEDELKESASIGNGACDYDEALSLAIAALKAHGAAEVVYQYCVSEHVSLGGDVVWGKWSDCDKSQLDWASGQHWHKTRILYTAPQPAMRPKRLEWVGSNGIIWESNSPFGSYELTSGGADYYLQFARSLPRQYGSLAEAKAFAQSDYDRRALACFEPQPESQAAQAVPDGWQPIETAPKDGTRLLLFRASDEMQFTGSWCDCYGWSDLNAPIAGVTHWMPLPAAPAPGGDE